MRKGIESRAPGIGKKEEKIEKKEIEPTQEEELIKRGVKIEEERNEIKNMPEVYDLNEDLKSLRAERDRAADEVVAARKKQDKILKRIGETEDKQKPFFDKVNRKTEDWLGKRNDFLRKTVLKEMGYRQRIAELPVDERKLIAKEANKDAAAEIVKNLPLEKLKIYYEKYDGAEKDFDEKLELARKKREK